MSCGVGCRCSSDMMLLWLWCRPAATAPIQPLAWKFPYAESVALKSKKKKKQKKTENSGKVIEWTLFSVRSNLQSSPKHTVPLVLQISPDSMDYLGASEQQIVFLALLIVRGHFHLNVFA